MAHGGTGRTKLDWVEAGRGLAAALVMFSHVRTTHLVPINETVLGFLGSAGVGFFFVLSGFIMVHVHRRDVDHPAAVPYFAWRRIGRIFPTYYVALALMVAVNLLQTAASRAPMSPSFLINQMALLPGERMFLGPAWTLRHELFFYLLFAIVLASRKLGLALFFCWFCLIAWHLFAYGPWTKEVNGFPDLYLHHINFYFFMGIGVALAELRGWLGRFTILCLGLSFVLLGIGATNSSLDPVLMGDLGLFPAYAAVLGGAVLVSKGDIRAPRGLVRLGGVSYSLYLVHLPIFILLRGVDHLVGRPLDPIWPLRVVIQCAVAVACAGLIFHFVERPVLSWVNRRQRVWGVFVGRPNRNVAS